MATGIEISYQLTDTTDVTTRTVLLRLLPTVALSDANLAAVLFAPLVDAAVDGKINQIEVRYNVTLPSGLKSTANAGAALGRIGLLTYNMGGYNAYSIDLPAVKFSEIATDGSGVLNVATGSVLKALSDALIQSTLSSSTVVNNVDPSLHPLVSLRKGRERYRKVKKTT